MTSTQLTSRRRIATESSAASQSTISCRLSGRETRTLAKDPDAVAADATGIVAAEAAMTPAREAPAAPVRSSRRVSPWLSTDVLGRESWCSLSVIAVSVCRDGLDGRAWVVPSDRAVAVGGPPLSPHRHLSLLPVSTQLGAAGGVAGKAAVKHAPVSGKTMSALTAAL